MKRVFGDLDCEVSQVRDILVAGHCGEFFEYRPGNNGQLMPTEKPLRFVAQVFFVELLTKAKFFLLIPIS